MLKKDIQEKNVLWIKRNMGQILYLRRDRQDPDIILWIKSEKYGRNLPEDHGKKIGCSISEPFGKLDRCVTKYELLKRMSMVNGLENDPVMKREKEWSVQGLYTYTTPLFKEAGLSDYRLLRLLQEDRENNTELYYTLKVYLLNENNVTMAADSLHIHRNTLVYRLKQIRECIEADINDNETARELLAFMMMYDISRQDEKRQK